jgi:hypothetical protein
MDVQVGTGVPGRQLSAVTGGQGEGDHIVVVGHYPAIDNRQGDGAVNRTRHSRAAHGAGHREDTGESSIGDTEQRSRSGPQAAQHGQECAARAAGELAR